MLSIRLARVGRVNLPAFRVVVQQKTRSPQSKVIENLGQYDPKTEPAQVVINQERLNHWISKGAKPTIAVADILVKQDLLKLEQVPDLIHQRALREASKKRVADKKAWQAKVAKEKKKRAEAKTKGSAEDNKKSTTPDQEATNNASVKKTPDTNTAQKTDGTDTNKAKPTKDSAKKNKAASADTKPNDNKTA